MRTYVVVLESHVELVKAYLKAQEAEEIQRLEEEVEWLKNNTEDILRELDQID